MIVVRDVFEVAHGRVTEAESLIRELQVVGDDIGLGPGRVLLDRTDSYFERPQTDERLVVEREFANLEVFSEKSRAAMSDDRWQAAWRACKPVLQRARREILGTIS